MGTLEEQMVDFGLSLRRLKETRSFNVARKTAELMRIVVSSSRKHTAEELIEEIKAAGVELDKRQPLAFPVGNIVRRVMKIVRDEQQSELAAQEEEKLKDTSKDDQSKVGAAEGAKGSLDQDEQNTLQNTSSKKGRPTAWKRKYNVIEAINELIEDLDESMNHIADQALEHVHAKEVILTFGYSNSVEKFLCTCALRQERAFSVIAVEGAPKYGGHKLAKKLASLPLEPNPVSVTVTTDASIFALMSRVNKVVIGAHALLANGGILATLGTHTVALAAKAHAVPVVVVLGIHKLVPILPRDPKLDKPWRCAHRSPGEIVDIDLIGEAYNESMKRALLASNSATQQKPQEDAWVPKKASLLHTEKMSYNSLPDFSLSSSPVQDESELPQGGEESASKLDNVNEIDQGVHLSTVNPAYDYLSPDLIALFVTDTGGHSPSYVYRLISEYFSPEDHDMLS